MRNYERHSEITKSLLDSVKIGDLIKVNDWNKPLRVKGVSKDYFVMATRQFGQTVYSVCEKKLWPGIRHNSMVGGMFHVGTDWWTFGSPVFTEGYDFDNPELTKKYLASFEMPEGEREHAELSQRSAIPIYELYIKRDRKGRSGENG